MVRLQFARAMQGFQRKGRLSDESVSLSKCKVIFCAKRIDRNAFFQVMYSCGRWGSR
jgi:hypothetical protein